MSIPDIANLARERASSKIQSVLKAEQNKLKPGHGIWYNFYYYPELKRSYVSHPISYKIMAMLGFLPLKPIHRLQINVLQRWRKSNIVGVRVSGPITNSPQYHFAMEGLLERRKQNEIDLHNEWVKNQVNKVRTYPTCEDNSFF